MATKGRKPGNGHEQTADNIFTLDALRPHLCDLAFATKKRSKKDILPARCAKCESPCFYGQRLIELMRQRGTDYTAGRKICQPGIIYEWSRSAPVETGMRRVLRRRTRSPHK